MVNAKPKGTISRMPLAQTCRVIVQVDELITASAVITSEDGELTDILPERLEILGGQCQRLIPGRDVQHVHIPAFPARSMTRSRTCAAAAPGLIMCALTT